MDSALPQAGLRVSLRWVICLRLSMGPAQTSGAWSKDWRMRATLAVFEPVFDTERLITSVPAMMVSGRVRLTEGMSLPVSRSSAVMWLLPPVCSEMRREWLSRQANQAGDAGRLGVTSTSGAVQAIGEHEGRTRL